MQRSLNSRRAVVFAAMLALVGRFLLPWPPPRTLEGLAKILGEATSTSVLPSDIAWEPSPGILTEFLCGRRVLFLARAGASAPRDLFRASVRLTLEGRPISVAGIRNLTATPLGDEQKLVIQDERAAFATSSYGKVESVTLLDLHGQAAPADNSVVDDVTSSITNWQESGSTAGIGKLDIAFDVPVDGVDLRLEGERAVVLASGHREFAVDAATGALEVDPDDAGARVATVPALRKRPILWAVDTVRAELGPEPVAWIEAAVFNARDLLRRSMYALFGPPSQEAAPAPAVGLAATRPPPKTLDANDSQMDGTVWPPAPIAPIWKNPEPGEGTWEAVSYPWLKRLTNVVPPPVGSTRTTEPPPYFYRTMIRPDLERPYAKVLVVAMDMRQLELDMEAGVEDPKPLTGAHGSGKIPRDPKILNRVVGAFNGAFKTTHGEYGMMVHRHVLLPAKPGAATLVVNEDRRVGLGTWGVTPESPDDVISFRQNLEPLVEDGKLSPSGRTQWGWQLTGTSMLTERSGICVTEGGQLYYVWGDEVSASTLGKAMLLARCTYGMHLDMNPHHTGFVFASVRSIANRDYDAKLLTPLMQIWPERYLEYSPKDFFYLMLRDPMPPGDVGWTEDVGSSPAPTWLPAVWHALVKAPRSSSDATVQVELTAFDAGRVAWKVQAARPVEGQKREFITSDLGEQDAHRVIAAVGIGNPHDARGGENVRAAFAKLPAAVLSADDTRGLALSPEGGASGKLEPNEGIELPLILSEGKIPDVARESHALRLRGAACVAPSGHTVVALATSDSDEPAAVALAKVGCSRAVALDRGAHRPTFLHRAGAGSPPLARYDESVLYAMGRAMAPRAYRWNVAP